MKRFFSAWIVIIFSLVGVVSALSFVQKNPVAAPVSIVQTVPSSSPVASLLPPVEKSPIVEPQTLSIPKINVTADVESVQEDSSGRMDVPAKVEDVGWYSLGFKPGENGSAVMAGHLDTATGAPAVFYYINQLSQGDEVIATDKNGKNLTFEVSDIKSYQYDQVPLEQVFRGDGKPRLNLITCAGVWNGGARNYSNRLVVYTVLKS